ncbi:MAG: hypothetical protein GX596_02550 [Propionibacterium sp.]|nr:hypothetical protein [Propionibacterium sp.]
MSVARDPSLAEALGHKPTVLAEGIGPDGEALVGTKSSLALRRDGAWRVFGWVDVERGSWNGETQTFRWWTTHEGEKFEVTLEDEGRLPELFLERVQASTVATFHYDLDSGGELRIVVRRALDGSDEMHFFALTSGGATLADPGTREYAIAETDRIKAEYAVD